MYPEDFAVLPPASDGICHLDRILGTDTIRLRSLTARELLRREAPRVEAFSRQAAPFLLYD